jgi:hypothetical protein
VGHSSGELAMSHGPQASWVEALAMASYERGRQSPYVGELRDAGPVGSSKSMSAMGHGTQTSRVKVQATIKSRSGR